MKCQFNEPENFFPASSFGPEISRLLIGPLYKLPFRHLSRNMSDTNNIFYINFSLLFHYCRCYFIIANWRFRAIPTVFYDVVLFKSILGFLCFFLFRLFISATILRVYSIATTLSVHTALTSFFSSCNVRLRIVR